MNFIAIDHQEYPWPASDSTFWFSLPFTQKTMNNLAFLSFQSCDERNSIHNTLEVGIVAYIHGVISLR